MFRIVTSEGEPIDLAMVAPGSDLSFVPDDNIIVAIEDLEACQKEIGQCLTHLKGTLVQRLQVDGATLRLTPAGYELKLATSRSYSYDMEQLLKVRDHITGEQFGTAFLQEWKVNKTKLNVLAKLGGRVKAIIDAATTAIEGGAKLEIVRKATPAMPPPAEEPGF